jgi:tetratricopeptide (TPR) repeat protein
VKLPTGKAEDLVAAATKTAWPPLIAQATHARGTWLRLTGDHERAREALRQASSLSLKCGDDDEAASAMIELSIDDAAQGQPAAAKPWIDLARAIWTRHGESPGLGAQLSEAEALYAFDLGHFEEGLARSQRMLELERKAHGDDALGEAKHHSLLCMAYVSGSRFDEGTREGRLALAAIEVAVGEAHPQTARYAARLAAAEIGAGELEVALSHARQALAIFEARSGPTDASVAQPLEWIGVALARRGDLAGARAAYERALTSLKARDAKPVIAELEEAAKLHAVLSKEPKEAAMSVVADLHLAYAAALWDGGGDRALALHEASLASDVFTALGADFESPKKAAEDWLVAHRQGRVSSGP